MYKQKINSQINVMFFPRKFPSPVLENKQEPHTTYNQQVCL